jgi:sulfite reductase (NADPH) flavoprotein alpha-component
LRILVAYGTETYNAEGLANESSDILAEHGYVADVLDLQDFEPEVLNRIDVLLVITSTFGDGEPPSNAEDAYDLIMSDEAPSMADIAFSVCGLGDTEYDQFCQCAKDFDRRFGELGGQRMARRVDCDTDFDDAYQTWIDSVVVGLSRHQKPTPNVSGASVSNIPKRVQQAEVDDRPSVALKQGTDNSEALLKRSSNQKVQSVGTRKNPFLTEVLVNRNLNHPFSEKETRHIVLALDSEKVPYKVGDALGIFPRNCPDLVRCILDAVSLPRDVAVSYDGQWYPLRDVLLYKVDINQIDKRMLKLVAQEHADAQVRRLLDDRKAASEYTNGHHLIDLLTSSGSKPEANAFVKALKPLAPRLYSIASSPNFHPNEVHLTVDVLRYDLQGTPRRGCSSSFLADRAGVGVEIAVYIQPTKDFTLCEDETPIIMIGPGTGIAPFRAFLEERAFRDAPGQSWLFFGAQRSGRDFLYRDELEAWKASGRLVRLDTAFSRDQSEKVYVQHRLLEHSRSIYHWLESGALVYVCGDASRMAKDVHETLIGIVQTEGVCSREDAEAYVKDLSKAGRYRRDVY